MDTLILSRSQIQNLLRFEEYIEVVEEAFRRHAEGESMKPGLMHLDSVHGEFHIKAGGLRLARYYFALKCNGGFFQNLQRFGMPNIQGIILLCDGENGYPLAVMDSTEITIQRTGAAAAVAAKYLARPNSSAVTICGCGTQGAVQLLAMKTVLPVRRVYAYDTDNSRASEFAERMSKKLCMVVEPVSKLSSATMKSDICITCTPSKVPYLGRLDVPEGMFIAAMGADSPDKQELDPALLRDNKVVVDLLDQCMHVGELHHAIDAGMALSAVHAELGEIIAGKKKGRISDQEIVVFDATGTALQDVAAAAAVYERALHEGVGVRLNLFG